MTGCFFSHISLVKILLENAHRCSALLLVRAVALARFSFMAQSLQYLNGFELCPFFLLLLTVWLLIEV